MPFQPIVPVWLGLNTANDLSASGMTDVRTGQVYNAGGLNLGDFFDLTDVEAKMNSLLSAGVCLKGRYVRVQVDSGATAANIKRGALAFQCQGKSLIDVQLLTAGTGQTAGTYLVSATGGGGSGATAQVVVGTGGTITSVALLAGGSGYTSVPTFTVAAGGTPGTIAAIMDQPIGLVTDASVTESKNLVRGVFLNAITPGNYGWIIAAGEAYVLASATAFTNVSPAIGDVIYNDTTVTTGLVTDLTAQSLLPSTIGFALSLPKASTMFPVCLDLMTFFD